GSGETLLLNPLGAFLLKAVSEKPMSIDELVQHAASFFRTTVDEELIQMVATSLYTFKAKGLVVSIAS
ncbi:MAG: hypothetical protein GY703_07050, partial [Gammaproteobacteria bacterium]|nr:hypothetical protein [Gammaproteobacteria bacterium]